jgi:phosphoglycolate phosphatase
MGPTTVLFDLDGTLSDSAPGILSSLRHAFTVNGLEPMTPEQELAVLGPPFYDSLPPLVGQHRVAAVIEAYRFAYTGGGMYDTVAYDGIGDVLVWLRERGATLAVATSKPEHYAAPIVEHLGFAGYFDTVCGDTMDGSRGSKALVVGEALHRLGDPAPDAVLMVGDRSHDVIGAREHGISCLGAGWGYGGPDELVSAGAIAIFADPVELYAALGGLFGAG